MVGPCTVLYFKSTFLICLIHLMKLMKAGVVESEVYLYQHHFFIRM